MKKLLITAVLILVPIIGSIAVLGWSLRVARRVIRRDREPLPDRSEFDALFGLNPSVFSCEGLGEVGLYVEDTQSGSVNASASGWGWSPRRR